MFLNISNMWCNAIDAEPHTLGWHFEQAELDLAKRNKCVALKSKCSFQMKAIFLHLNHTPVNAPNYKNNKKKKHKCCLHEIRKSSWYFTLKIKFLNSRYSSLNPPEGTLAIPLGVWRKHIWRLKEANMKTFFLNLISQGSV